MHDSNKQMKMKREGRQHGMVQAFDADPQPPRRIINQFSSPTTRGLCTKVSTKPNNHSKYTSRCRHRSRCRGCHVNPPCKSLGKVKGLHKVRSMWTVVDGFRGSTLSGFSASGVLDYLDADDCVDRDDDAAGEFGFDEDDGMSFWDVLELLHVEDESWLLVEEI